MWNYAQLIEADLRDHGYAFTDFFAADITGKWSAEFSTPVGGAQKYTFEFKVDGEKLTGKAYFERLGQKGEADLLEGKIAGDEISFLLTERGRTMIDSTCKVR